MKKLHPALTKTLRTAVAIAATAGLAVGAGAASAAQTISIAQHGFVGSSLSVDIEQFGRDSNDVSAGLLNFDLQNGKSFAAFCVELGQFTSSSFKTYQVGSFDAAQGRNLQNLFSASYASVDTNSERAAFQLAVWELTHESKSGKFSVTEGSSDADGQGFNLNDSSDNYNSLKKLSNDYLSAGAAYQGSGLFQIDKLSNASHQDLLRFNAVTAVPEPTSYALLLAGLGVIGFVSRRRGAKAV
jgi:hypothetical protein